MLTRSLDTFCGAYPGHCVGCQIVNNRMVNEIDVIFPFVWLNSYTKRKIKSKKMLKLSTCRKGEDIQKGCRRVNIWEILGTHV
jgi:hypothetical protein